MSGLLSRNSIVVGASHGLGHADASSSRRKAATLRTLHVPGKPLVLPNAWDAASARTTVSAGFPVVATSSSATAAILGYDDGEVAPVGEVLSAAARIARAVSLPGTVDFERGYRLAPDDAGHFRQLTINFRSPGAGLCASSLLEHPWSGR